MANTKTERDVLNELLSDSEKQIASLIAFGLFKQHEHGFEDDLAKNGQTLTPKKRSDFASAQLNNLDAYRLEARRGPDEFAAEVVEISSPEIKREAIPERVERAAGSTENSTARYPQFWLGVFSSVIAWFVSPGLLYLAVWGFVNGFATLPAIPTQ